MIRNGCLHAGAFHGKKGIWQRRPHQVVEGLQGFIHRAARCNESFALHQALDVEIDEWPVCFIGTGCILNHEVPHPLLNFSLVSLPSSNCQDDTEATDDAQGVGKVVEVLKYPQGNDQHVVEFPKCNEHKEGLRL
eukprot:CAMPEP_0206473756 /NCGR_PEP_ID=MMETSP0324_2-20121206/33073_1 /ASSEMBLY_ACC=CAM_ASM_000836 /TAXON_ID=2866 /ORGANISM="Crypthecodinium cohnii, Strain Seligo" /LENGTH=134 /DNA_ID=CAMNT_0053948783 /DNA_START=597 /DNA_END=1001 /DNA_ORIENTATION=-